MAFIEGGKEDMTEESGKKATKKAQKAAKTAVPPKAAKKAAKKERQAKKPVPKKPSKKAAPKPGKKPPKAAPKKKPPKKATKAVRAAKKPPGRSILFTGFPGFIGQHLVSLLLEDPDVTLYLLVERRFLKKAGGLLAAFGAQAKRTRIVVGDITRENLGIEPAERVELEREITVIYHLAAVYSLNVPRDVAYRVNLNGTQRILDFAKELPKFRRLNYFSTCFVAGNRHGTVLEEELDRGQTFKNYYEETKFLAEKEVRARMTEIPTAIFRPGVVIGDSRSGEIDKYDGPYYLIRAFVELERRGRLPFLGPVLGLARSRCPFHLVPVDYLVEAVRAIAARADSTGRTFQVVDPSPLSFDRIFDLLMKHFGVSPPPVRLPIGWVKLFFQIPGVEQYSRIPLQVFDYAETEIRFDSSNTLAMLRGTGISCPRLFSYFGTIVNWVRRHPEIKLML
jgi:thioester reductase-like protein